MPSTLSHCAYCLKPLSPEGVKKCSKCQRRTYCGKDCQAADWTTKFLHDPTHQRGQGHKDWCGLPYGEEGLDWKVVKFEGKGLGVVAVRDLSKGYRIMVDACQLTPTSHPMTHTLEPKDGSYFEKFKLNAMGCASSDDVREVLCLRMARVNHDCEANATHIYDKRSKVKILLAKKDIPAGAEITIEYASFVSVAEPKSLEEFQRSLQLNWRISCPPSCFCKNAHDDLLKLITKARALDQRILQLGSTGHVQDALGKVEELLVLHEKLQSPVLEMKRTLYDGFQVGIMKKATLSRAIEYGKKYCELIEGVFHPKSMADVKKEVDPVSHANYMEQEDSYQQGNSEKELREVQKLLYQFGLS